MITMTTLKEQCMKTGIKERAYRRKLKIPNDIPVHKIKLNPDKTWEIIEE